MLIKEQEEHIATLPKGDIVHIHSFDPKIQEVALRLVEDLKIALPGVMIFHFGSTKIGIVGENSIDIGVVARARFEEYEATLAGIFGAPVLKDEVKRFVRWVSSRHGYKVELFLSADITKRIQDYLDTQRLLEARGDLRREYEQLKLSWNNKSLRDYTAAKYEFFNKILYPHAA